VGVKDRLIAIYSFSGAIGWLAGAIAYYSVLYAYQSKDQTAFLSHGCRWACLSPRYWGSSDGFHCE
jgi:hypothetical protein